MTKHDLGPTALIEDVTLAVFLAVSPVVDYSRQDMSTVTARMTTAQAPSAGITAKLYRRLFAQPADDEDRRSLMNQLSQWRWLDRYGLDEIAQRLEMTREQLTECIESFPDLRAVLLSQSRVLTGTGSTAQSLRKSASSIGISPKALRQRLAKMAPERALAKPAANPVTTYEIDGVRRSQRQWAFALQLPPSTLSYRVRKHVADGQTTEQAIRQEIQRAKRSLRNRRAEPLSQV